MTIAQLVIKLRKDRQTLRYVVDPAIRQKNGTLDDLSQQGAGMLFDEMKNTIDALAVATGAGEE